MRGQSIRGSSTAASAGFGQSGPRARLAGHDLNYLAEAGLLALTCGADGAPALPHAPIADIAGGSYPARDQHPARADRARPQRGVATRYLDGREPLHARLLGVRARLRGRCMADPASGWSPAARHATRSTHAGGGHIAAAPIEERFWVRFCELIELDAALRRRTPGPAPRPARGGGHHRGHRARIGRSVFERRGRMLLLVTSLEEAVRDPHFVARERIRRHVAAGPCRHSGAAGTRSIRPFRVPP